MAKSIFAAVMTDEGTGAISTVQLYGKNAKSVIKKIFIPAGGKERKLEAGVILLGHIIDGEQTIDQVTVGYEGAESFAINCHGNPLIVEEIMRILGENSVELVTTEELLREVLSDQKGLSTIAIEAKLSLPKAKTLAGSKIITNQIESGLNKKVKEWLSDIDSLGLDELKDQAKRILDDSAKARLIIYGCRVVLAGPANSGKSTLLNCLCGREKAIVTDIKGTTRDWVSGRCQIDPVALELIDTAGLAEELTSGVDKKAQEKSAEMLQSCDLVLLVLDNNQSVEQLEKKLLEKIAGKKVLCVLNKADLEGKFDTAGLPRELADCAQISAKFEAGIEDLKQKVLEICGVGGFDLGAAVAVTERQRQLLEQVRREKTKEGAISVITELLNGQTRV